MPETSTYLIIGDCGDKIQIQIWSRYSLTPTKRLEAASTATKKATQSCDSTTLSNYQIVSRVKSFDGSISNLKYSTSYKLSGITNPSFQAVHEKLHEL